MAVPTVTITGNVLTPDGVGSPGGTIVLALSAPGSVEDSGVGTQRVAAVKAIAIGGTGAVSFTIVPNDAISPAGTIYRADFRLPSGHHWVEWWSIASSPATLEIGDITQAVAVLTGREAEIPAVGALPTPGTTYRRRLFVVEGGAGEADEFYICLKGSDDSYTWVLVGIGG